MASDMDLGAFSISLTVADLEASKAFYEKLGPGSFVVIDPDGNPILVDQHR